MPKRGSDLMKFLREALYDNIYSNLYWINQDKQLFCLRCIHGGNKDWSQKECQIFKDWGNKKKRRMTEKNIFSEGRQRLLAAMNKSKLLRKFKKESTCSLKFYQFIEQPSTDSESASDEVSDGCNSPGLAETCVTVEMANGSPSIVDLSFGLPYECQEILAGVISDTGLPTSTQNVVDPNFLTDGTENTTTPLSKQDLSGLLSLLDISVDVPDNKADLVSDRSPRKLEENICFTDVYDSAGGNAPVTAAGAMTGIETSAALKSATDLPVEACNSEPVLPPIQLFMCGDYIIGVTKIPVS